MQNHLTDLLSAPMRIADFVKRNIKMFYGRSLEGQVPIRDCVIGLNVILIQMMYFPANLLWHLKLVPAGSGCRPT
jgi:hypothetical protein